MSNSKLITVSKTDDKGKVTKYYTSSAFLSSNQLSLIQKSENSFFFRFIYGGCVSSLFAIFVKKAYFPRYSFGSTTSPYMFVPIALFFSVVLYKTFYYKRQRYNYSVLHQNGPALLWDKPQTVKEVKNLMLDAKGDKNKIQEIKDKYPCTVIGIDSDLM